MLVGQCRDGFKLNNNFLEAGGNDRVTLALAKDFSHLIRVNSRDSRAPEKLLAFLSVYAVQFCVQP